MRLLRSIMTLLTMASLLAGLAPSGASALLSPAWFRHPAAMPAQVDGLSAAATAARAFSRLEAERDFDALYERMHPDALAVVPRSVVVGWYESFFTDRDTDELTVTEVVPEPWTWGVTGTTYDDAVTVKYVQPYTVAGVTDEVTGEVHLVPFADDWGWFFGASRSFVDEQIALYGDDGSATRFALSQEDSVATPETVIPREVLFPDPLHAHVDTFWEARFLEAGRPYDPPHGVVAFDEPIVTGCGHLDPEQEAAFYCVIDETIYYSAEFRRLIEEQVGDFAWVIVVAHEWGHHVQAQLGFDIGISPDRAGEETPIEVDQQADCLAGTYAADAERTGWLDPGDIDEALAMTEMAGDERVDALLTGYSRGLTGCELDLLGSLGSDAAP